MALDFSYRRKSRRGIGLTALIDVIFILVVFFMMASSFYQFRQVNLAGIGRDHEERIEPLPLFLHVAGGLESADGQSVDLIIKRAVQEDRPIALHITDHMPVQAGIDALDYLHQQGVASVSLVPEVARAME